MYPVHHTRDPTGDGTQVQGHRRVELDRGVGVVGLDRWSVETGLPDDLVEHRPDPGGEGVPGGEVGRGAVVEGDPLTVGCGQPAGQGDAGPRQGLQAHAATARSEQRLGCGHHRRVDQVLWPLLEESALDQPLHRVPAAVTGGGAADRAGGQDHPPARGQRSSAIWQPDWALPTTRTPPSGSWPGLR